MSHIDDLIAEHCPNGVPFRALGEVGEFIRGNGLQKKDFVESGFPCIHYGQIYTHYGTSAATTKSFIAPELAATLKQATPGDLVVTTTSENVEDVCTAVAWLGNGPIAIGGHSCVYRHTLDPMYVAYYFQTDQFEMQKRKYVSGTKVKDIKLTDLAKVRIPVPPAEVQRAIVSILNKMEKLEAELEAELEARQTQYEHYRRFQFTQIVADRQSLADLGRWHGGVTPSKSNPTYWDGGDIPWLASMDVRGIVSSGIRGRVTEKAIQETPLRVLAAPTVAVVMRSNILRRMLPIGLVTMDTTVNQDVRVLVPGPHVDAAYVYYALSSFHDDIWATCVRTDGSMAAVDSGRLLAYTIPLPTLDEQRRIAKTLSTFEAMVNDLSSGLPAEIAARRKQYEYYRDRLLTFKELAA